MINKMALCHVVMHMSRRGARGNQSH